MVRLKSPLTPNIYKTYKGLVDIYDHPRDGLIARAWPRYSAPAQTDAWKETRDRLKDSWSWIKKMSVEGRDRMKEVTTNNTRTTLDMLRASAMLAKDQDPRLIELNNVEARYIGNPGQVEISFDVDPAFIRGSDGFHSPVDIMTANAKDQLIPSWKIYPKTPKCQMKRAPKRLPYWAPIYIPGAGAYSPLPYVSPADRIDDIETEGTLKNDPENIIPGQYSGDMKSFRIGARLENSKNCGGANDNTQDGEITFRTSFPEGSVLQVSLFGMIEGQNLGYDEFRIHDVSADEALLIEATQTGNECNMVEEKTEGQWTTTHDEQLWKFTWDSGDELYHRNAWAMTLIKSDQPAAGHTHTLRVPAVYFNPRVYILPTAHGVDGRRRILGPIYSAFVTS